MSATRPPMTAGPMLRALRVFSARASTLGPVGAAGEGEALGAGLPSGNAAAQGSIAPAISAATTGPVFIPGGYVLAAAVVNEPLAEGREGVVQLVGARPGQLLRHHAVLQQHEVRPQAHAERAAELPPGAVLDLEVPDVRLLAEEAGHVGLRR